MIVENVKGDQPCYVAEKQKEEFLVVDMFFFMILILIGVCEIKPFEVALLNRLHLEYEQGYD